MFFKKSVRSPRAALDLCKLIWVKLILSHVLAGGARLPELLAFESWFGWLGTVRVAELLLGTALLLAEWVAPLSLEPAALHFTAAPAV